MCHILVSPLLCGYLCGCGLCTCMHKLVCHVHRCGSQRLKTGAPSLFFRLTFWNSSLIKPGAQVWLDWLRLARMTTKFLRFSCLCLPRMGRLQAQGTTSSLYMCAGNLNEVLICAYVIQSRRLRLDFVWCIMTVCGFLEDFKNSLLDDLEIPQRLELHNEVFKKSLVLSYQPSFFHNKLKYFSIVNTCQESGQVFQVIGA